MRNLGILAVMIMSITASGCVFNAQKATINPQLAMSHSNVGHGVSVGLRVSDERPTKSLGHRGSAAGTFAEITSDQDMAAVFKAKIAYGLSQMGFHVVPFDPSHEPDLTIEIRSLTYSTSTGFWSGGVNVTGAIKAIANNGGKSYEQFYRFDKTNRVVFEPTASKNEDKLNAAASSMLQQMLNDQGLIGFLVSTSKSN